MDDSPGERSIPSPVSSPEYKTPNESPSICDSAGHNDDIEDLELDLLDFDPEEPGSKPPLPSRRGFRNGQDAKDSDVFIAVMGVTGSGKSSFISACSEKKAKIGHSLEACTSTVDVYPCNFFPGHTVYLIDTPGFDDTDKSDTDILREIAAWLADSYKNEKILLHGIIYLHRITDLRMQGSAKRNLFLFQKLCGEDAFKRVILATTMWDRILKKRGHQDKEKRREAEEREEELMNNQGFWGWMVEKGSRVHRYHHHRDTDSAKKILTQLLTNSTPAAIELQKQLVDDGLTLDQTSAGRELQIEFIKEREKWTKELKQVEEDIKAVLQKRDAETHQIMQEERLKYMELIRKAQEKADDLSLNVESLIKERDERIARMERKLLHQEQTHNEKLKLERAWQEKIRADYNAGSKHGPMPIAANKIPYGNLEQLDILPPVSVSLFGPNFNMKSHDNWRRNGVGPTQTAPEGTKVSAAIFGDEGSWVARYSDGTWYYSPFFEQRYPDLQRRFSRHKDSNLATCTLGTGRYYYARWLDDSWSCYAHSDTIKVLQRVARRCKRTENYKVNSVALGYENSYVITYGSKTEHMYEYDLKGHYPLLFQVLDKRVRMEIIAIALNSQNKNDYILVYFDQDKAYSISYYSENPSINKSMKNWSEKALSGVLPS